jgi:hypothetical protein
MIPLENCYDVTKLDGIRVTAWATFDKCPRRWAAGRFGEIPPSENKYTLIGTAVHAVIENYLRYQFELEDFPRTIKYLEYYGVNEQEQENLYTYLESLEDMRARAFAIEHEFFLQVPTVTVPIPGHIDVAYQLEDTSILIQDHKTNRRFKGAEWWSQQDQPRMYAWGARQQWPGYEIYYEIGYVNQDRRVRWRTTPEDDEEIEASLQRRWRKMLACSELRVFPERFNDDCGYCPLRSNCKTYNRELSNFLDSLNGRQSVNLIEELRYLEKIRKVADDAIETIETELIAQALASTEPIEVDDHLVSVEYSSRRHVDAWELLQRTQHPGFPQLTTDEFLALFSAKVGGVDRIKKRYPQIAERLDAIVGEKTSKTPRLVIKKSS